jgi:hypothetical protein
VFRNRVLRRYGPKREKVEEGWRRLHNEMLYDSYTSLNIIRMARLLSMKWVGHVAHIGGMRNVYKIFIGKLEVEKLLGRPRHRWEDNIRMDLRDIGCKGVDWILLVQVRDQWWALVNTVLNLLTHSLHGAEYYLKC